MGLTQANSTSFKKGQPPWNKGKHAWEGRQHPRGMLGKSHSEESKNKIRGFKHTEAWKKWRSISQLGDKHWNWQGGKSSEEYSVDWNETLKRSIRERDKYTCQMCSKQQGNIVFHVHHIDHNKKNCNPDNLLTLCNSCHTIIHNRRT